MATQNAWSSHGCFEPPTDFHLYTTFKCQANFQHICKTSNIKFTLLLAIGQQWGCTIWEDCYGLGHGVSARTLQLADAQVRMERGRRIRDEGFPLGNVWFTVHVLYTYYIHGQDIYFISYIYIIYISRGKLSYYFNRICNIYIYAIMCMSILCMYLSMHKDWCNWVLSLVSWLIDEKNHADHRICL